MSAAQTLATFECADGTLVAVTRVASRRSPRSDVSTYHLDVSAPEGRILEVSISEDAARALAVGIVQVLR